MACRRRERVRGIRHMTALLTRHGYLDFSRQPGPALALI
jgi:hypothetical protein